MNLTKKDLLWGWAFLFMGLAYFFGLFLDLTGDSGLYAAISRQMVESGDWLNLNINGRPYDQKPHLFFWLAGIGIKLFGNTNFAFKLFPFLYGISGFYFTYRLAKTIYSKEVGKLAVFIVASSQISFLYFFDLHTDSVLQTGVVLALWQLAEYLKFKKIQNFAWAFAGVGLAMLAKGPVGAVIPFFALLFYLTSVRDFKQLFHLKWLAGAGIALLIVSPTLIHLHKSFGTEGIKFYFITNNFGRITGDLAGSNGDPFFYLHTLLWAFLPWTVFVLRALFSVARNWYRKSQKDHWSYFLLGSVLALLTVFSIAKGKAPNYFLICVAPLSVVCAKWLKTKDVKERYLLYPLLATGALNLLLNTVVLPHLFEYQSARQVLALYEKNSRRGDVLFNYHPEDYELFFYAKDKVNVFGGWDDFIASLENESTWIYTTQAGYDELKKYKPDPVTEYEINYRGMNELNLSFLHPKTRESSLKTNYLVKLY